MHADFCSCPPHLARSLSLSLCFSQSKHAPCLNEDGGPELCMCGSQKSPGYDACCKSTNNLTQQQSQNGHTICISSDLHCAEPRMCDILRTCLPLRVLQRPYPAMSQPLVQASRDMVDCTQAQDARHIPVSLEERLRIGAGDLA